ncbi:MAG: UDP-glucose/GDP-mannose dehydrogenase family protein [Candidatus Sumerlaeia bacterium]
MNVAVIGTGYVGLVTGVVFADLGNEVIGVDKDPAKVERLASGEPTIFEPGLREMLRRNIEDARLSFTCDVEQAVRRSDVIFIAVGTPPKAGGETDLGQVEDAAKAIARAIDRYKVIVNKSTVPVGTGLFVRDIIERNQRRRVEFDVVSNPEFLREGSAIQDTLMPDRIVIGAPNKTVALTLLELYAPLERPMLIVDVASAEMIKYASNSFLATKISFINAIASLCEKVGADVLQVAKGMGYDRRIGPDFLQAGLGFGGSCFPKDVLSLIHTAKTFDEDNELLRSVMRINDGCVRRFCRRIEKRLAPLAGRRVGVLGLSFKPNTDDLREARSLEIIRWLLEKGALVRAYDPVALGPARELIPAIEPAANAYEAAEQADAVVIVTEWNEFKLLNLERLRSVMKQPVVFDGRNIYTTERIEKCGLEYHGIGRGVKT